MENRNLFTVLNNIKQKIEQLADYNERAKNYNKKLENMLTAIEYYGIEEMQEESNICEMETSFMNTCILEESRSEPPINKKEALFNSLLEYVSTSLMNRKAFITIFNRLYMSEPVTISTLIRECGVARYRVMEVFKAIKKYENENSMVILKKEDRGGDSHFAI